MPLILTSSLGTDLTTEQHRGMGRSSESTSGYIFNPNVIDPVPAEIGYALKVNLPYGNMTCTSTLAY